MASNKNISEFGLLLQYEIALNNAASQPDISALLDELGYNNKTLDKGQKLLDLAKQQYDKNKIEDDETREIASIYKEINRKLYDKYRLDRKKTRVIFRKDLITLQQLGCDESIPNSWANRIGKYEKFYQTALNDKEIQQKLLRLKITKQELNTGIVLINETIKARENYYREVGESEQATKDKDSAIAKIDDWMLDFYSVAKIALDDKPQLLEALVKKVKS